MTSSIVILTLAIVFVAAGLFAIALLILWPLLAPGRHEEDEDFIEHFEVDTPNRRWLP